MSVTQVVNILRDTLNISSPTSEKEAPLKQPDISYHPDPEKWRARTARRLQENPSLPSTPLPDGFPQQVDSPLVWEGKDWTDEKQWVYELNAEQLKEIDDALHHFNSLGKSAGHIAPTTFPLPTLGPILVDLSRELHQGRGFFVIRTIPVDSYSPADTAAIYAGVSSYVGALRGIQDPQVNGVIGHIKDLTKTYLAKSIGGPAYTTDKQVFHTDIGDIISLFALDIAAEGGVSRISSTWRVYNEIAKTRPDLIKTLSEPWPVDNFGGNPAYTPRPLLYYLDTKMIIQYARRTFTGYLALPRSSDIPPITEAQAEALDTVHFLGEKYALGLNFQKGDIQYINNLGVFHGRDAFRDSPEHTRHLIRLWLRNEELAWKTPEPLQPVWKRLYYTVTPEEQTFQLEAGIRSPVKGKDVQDTNSGKSQIIH